MRRAVFNMRDDRPVWAPPAAFVRRLHQAFPSDWEVLEIEDPVSGRGDGSGTSPAALSAMRGAEIYFGLGLPHDLLMAGLAMPGRLRWVHTGAAGVASLLHPELIESDIVLTNSAGIHAEPIAETVLGMMLHFARGLDHAVQAQREAEWRPGAYESSENGIREVGGATLGLIGYGGIGREIARRARALDMHVMALRRSPVSADMAEVLTGADGLRRLLERSDVVVLCVPATAQTRGMIGRDELGLMRAGAILINVARGSVLDEAALLDVLSAGHLRGAGLDVFAAEPLPRDSPFWNLPNVLITPHVSATSPRYWEREGELILANVRRYLAGEDLLNVVDAARGY